MKAVTSICCWLLAFCAFCWACPAAQDRPPLEILNTADSVQLRWLAKQNEPSPKLLKYQVERSFDLQSWSAYGPPVRSAATNQQVSRPIERTSSPAFYRLFVSADSRTSALASGGESVFGYSDLFAEALNQIGQISPEQFNSRFSPDESYKSALDWDPTTAEFWPAFNQDPAAYNVGLIPGVDDLRQFNFRLNETELALFKKNGFVVSERLGAYSCGEIYSRLWIDDLPVFITTDSLLHAWHRSYDMMLADIEQTILFANFQEMLRRMAEQIPIAEPRVTEALRPSLLDADYYIAVARSLLQNANVPSALGQDARVATTLQRIAGEQLDECFDLFGAPRAVDFSQFKPRGHYADDFRPQLKSYFKCLMWLGRVDFRVAGGPYRDSGCEPEHKAPSRELGTAIVLNQLLADSGQLELWRQSEDLISTFVGWTDSMTFSQLGSLLVEAGINTLNDVRDTNTLTGIQMLLENGRLGLQSIASDYFISPWGGPPAALPQSFTVFGQKFVLDSWALSQLVADRILWVENGATNKVQRRVPSALDVAFSVLGNDQIVPELVARMTRADAGASTNYPVRFRDGLNYQHNLAAVRSVVDQQPASAWNQNIYMQWLDSLRQLSSPIAEDPRLPDAMRTRAWALKDLNTQLASWTQLRHDTILYAKQSYTDTFACSYPKGFVEPRPSFWRALQTMAENTARLIGQTQYGAQTNLQRSQIEFLGHFASISEKLLHLSEKELRQEAFTDQEHDFISTTLVGFRGYAGYWTIQDGWYPKLFYRSSYAFAPFGGGFDQAFGSVRWDPLIADMHTDPPCGPCEDPGSVLHQAVGNVNLLLIAVNNGPDRCVYAGPVMSHFEFPVVGSPQRLSDTDWQIRLAKAGLADPSIPEMRPYASNNDWSGVPPSPEWTAPFLVPQR